MAFETLNTHIEYHTHFQYRAGLRYTLISIFIHPLVPNTKSHTSWSFVAHLTAEYFLYFIKCVTYSTPQSFFRSSCG